MVENIRLDEMERNEERRGIIDKMRDYFRSPVCHPNTEIEMDEKVKILELDNDINSKRIEKLEIMNRRLENQLAISMEKLNLFEKQNQKMSKKIKVLEKMNRKTPRTRQSVKKGTVSKGVPKLFQMVKFDILTDGMMEIRVNRLDTKEERRGTIGEIMEYFRSLVRHPVTQIECLSILHNKLDPASNERFQETFTSLTDSLEHQLNVQQLVFSYDASEQKLIEILGALCPTRLRILTLMTISGASDKSDFGEVSKMEQWKNATSLNLYYSECGIHVFRNLPRFSHFETLEFQTNGLDKKMILEVTEFYKKNKSADRDFTIKIWNRNCDELKKEFGMKYAYEKEIKQGVFFTIGLFYVLLCNYREKRS